MSGIRRAGRARSKNKNRDGGSLNGGDGDAWTPLAEKARSPRTRATYAQALRGLDEWLAGRPATDETLAEYLKALYDRGLAAPSATNAVAAAIDRAKLKALRVRSDRRPGPRWPGTVVLPRIAAGGPSTASLGGRSTVWRSLPRT